MSNFSLMPSAVTVKDEEPAIREWSTANEANCVVPKTDVPCGAPAVKSS
jgi:hypothetical protein